MKLIESDELLVVFGPIAVYWIYSGIYEWFSCMEKYRLHSKKEEDNMNLVSKRDVMICVLFQQAIQASSTFLLIQIDGNSSSSSSNTNKVVPELAFVICSARFIIAMFIFDTWQYFVHRYMHSNRYLYRHVHSWHHRIVAPYPFAAQYNHPIDGIVTETLAGAVAFFISGMTPGTSIIFFIFATIKGIDDHCGFMLPWNPFHVFFGNNTAYHDIHHQVKGHKYNFSQPFFVHWDKILGTYKPFTVERREDGGLEARIIKS
ncbi:sphinganine C(4)-monooxygenase 2-like protein [Carex littledalei]|uniref:aldehyde oxygenase (deformylating) n=1 Tax=Carex littledalei TaxID=544730 RepID=A0A833RFE4_9POAL|nr:sphinganine C(4)-monooxygenase 2-like protein [Carex littledalei]